MTNVVIVRAKRTPIGSFMGGLSDIPAHELAAGVISSFLLSDTLKKDISEVILGQVLTAGSGQNPARQTAVKAGIPYGALAYTINQVCGSALKSVILSSQSIMLDSSKIIIAGGQENMSLAPNLFYSRKKCVLGHIKSYDTLLHDGLTDAFYNYHMGVTAENIAKKLSITREEQDEFAFISQIKATKAEKKGKFIDEIVIVNDKCSNDEFIKSDTSIDKLAKLKPVFDPQGTVTAGNASGINDGAACLLLMSETEALKRNLSIMCRIVSYAESGIDPQFMGLGPIEAVRKALKKASWNIDDLDLIECNEAFAVQSLAVERALAWDKEKVNVNGGAIALGHPIGASGARCLVSLIYEMKRRKSKKGIVTLCIGGGMGIAMCVEGADA